MNNTPVWQRLWFRCALIIGFWALLGLVDAGEMLYLHTSQGRPLVWWRILGVAFLDWSCYGLLTPLILFLAARLPLTPPHLVRNLALHAAVSVCCALVVVTAAAGLVPLIALPRNPLEPLTFEGLWREFLLYKIHLYVLVYWVVVGARLLLDYAARFRERELRASQLETRLAQAQLQVLKMQLHPHFLFNTLNAISALIHQDPDAAERMVVRLGDLLRLTLENAAAQEVSLRQELAMIGPYLEIQQSRLGSRLAVRLDIDPEAMDARVPNLVLQPLVENAIQHGIAPRPGGGRIELSARRQGDRLLLQVRDEGPPYPNGRTAAAEGAELSNTRARLQQMYGPLCRFTFEADPPGSHVLTMEIPFQAPASEVGSKA